MSRRVARIGRIRFVFKPVTFSGPRFRRGLVRGAAEYARLFWPPVGAIRGVVEPHRTQPRKDLRAEFAPELGVPSRPGMTSTRGSAMMPRVHWMQSAADSQNRTAYGTVTIGSGSSGVLSTR